MLTSILAGKWEPAAQRLVYSQYFKLLAELHLDRRELSIEMFSVAESIQQFYLLTHCFLFDFPQTLGLGHKLLSMQIVHYQEVFGLE